MKRVIAALSISVFLLVGCGDKGNPSAPSTNTTTGGAVLAISRATVVADQQPLIYHLSVTVAETSGRAATTVTSINWSFSTGRSGSSSPNSRVTAGSSVTFSGDFNAASGDPGTQATVTVTHTDEGGRTGTVSSTAPITVNPPPVPDRFVTIVGIVTDAASRTAIVGGSVTVTDSRGTQRSGGTDGNGFFSIAPVLAGQITVRATANTYDAVSRTLTVDADTRVDFQMNKTAAPTPAVEYRITGTARRCDATYENSTGGTNQQTVNIPFSYTWPSARSGDFLYMSCQISTGGDGGNITVQIFKNGALYRSAQAIGFPNIATASGSY